MDDCEFYGSKHHFKFKGAINVTMLTGGLVFDCKRCSTRVIADRLYFYLALKTPAGRR